MSIKKGNRFIAEDNPSEIEVINATLAQTGQTYYMITDEAEAESRGMTLEELQQMAAENQIYTGDTLADLAAAFGADPDTLQKTVEEFNQSVETQSDAFGRTTWANKIATGPFYAVAFTPEMHSTLGGLKINTEAQVLDTDGYPISGLYAAGEVTGDIQGKERQGGNTIPDAITFGRIAGTNVAADSAE